MSQEKRDQIDSLLASLNVTCHFTHLGLHLNGGWLGDTWHVELKDSNGKTFSFADFRTGVGNRKITVNGQKYLNDLKMQRKSLTDAGTFKFHSDTWNSKPVKPSVSDFLYNINLDSQLSLDSFEDFCSNIGLDTDSRKALDNYLQCQNIVKEYSRFFSNETREQINTILQDY
jgi:hypothetical protein